MKTLILLAMSTPMLFSFAASAASENAAVVLHDLDHPAGCQVFGLAQVPLSTTDEIHTTATKSGNVTLTCHFNIPAGFEPLKAIKTEGFTCGIYLPDGRVFTTDSRFIANPGNRATLTCTIKSGK